MYTNKKYIILIHPCILGNRGVITKISLPQALISPRMCVICIYDDSVSLYRLFLTLEQEQVNFYFDAAVTAVLSLSPRYPFVPYCGFKGVVSTCEYLPLELAVSEGQYLQFGMQKSLCASVSSPMFQS